MLKRLIALVDDFFYRVILRNILKLSKLGHGFIVSGAESGENFEYIYNNESHGFFFIGKYIDKILLDLPSVQATRARKDAIKNILRQEIQNNRFANRKTRILDLASGGARYLRELKNEHNADCAESLCIDKNLRCVQLGRSLAKREEVKNIKFIRGDIFRAKHLRTVSGQLFWKPNVVIASGLFIYFNNPTVEGILKEVYAILDTKGLIVFQSYEKLSSRKLMRKTSKTSSGDQWTLYYRKPDFWMKLLEQIGFTDIFVSRDKWQMNNICTARKNI